MTDAARLIAVADLLVDEGRHLDRAAIALEAAERVARLTRAGRALVELAGPAGHVHGSYPGPAGAFADEAALEARLGTDHTVGMVRVTDPVDGSFSHLDAWLVEVVARRVESQVATVELHESELASREALHDAQLAGELQRALVTADQVSTDEIQAVGRLIPARRVGGDVFDLVEVAGGVLAVLADVSGKGAPASLLTSAVLSSVHHHAAAVGPRPGEMVRAVGASLSPMLERTGRLVTLAVAGIDTADGLLRVASAGHHPVLLAGTDSVEAIRATAPPLGVVLPGGEERAFPIGGHTALLLASDGLTDQCDPAGTPFGMDRLADALSARTGNDPEMVADEVLAAVRSHAAGAPQDDDQAVVVMTSKVNRR